MPLINQDLDNFMGTWGLGYYYLILLWTKKDSELLNNSFNIVMRHYNHRISNN